MVCGTREHRLHMCDLPLVPACYTVVSADRLCGLARSGVLGLGAPTCYPGLPGAARAEQVANADGGRRGNAERKGDVQELQERHDRRVCIKLHRACNMPLTLC